MPRRQILGLVGSIILFVGVFTPIVSLPIVGSMNYFQNGRGDGVIILVFAIISVVLTFTKKYKALLITGVGSLAVLAFTFINFQMRMSEVSSQMREGLANNPFGGLGEAMLSTVQIQWGWAVLIVGAALLIAAALLKEDITESVEESGEFLSFGGVGGSTSSTNNVPLYIGLACVGLAALGFAVYSFSNASNPLSTKTNPLLNTNSKQSQQTSSASSTNPEEVAYVSNVSVGKVEVGLTILDEDGVFGEIKNNGNRTLNEVEITIYFLDKQGNPVSEKNYSPVFVSQSNFSSDSNSPLKPKYSRKFGYKADDAPSEWAKRVKVQVTKVKFAP